MSSAQLKKFASVKPALLEWRNNLPFSLEFNDVYYSDSGALAESEHVFLKGCQLENDWLTKNQSLFYIAELGFGSGLNFFNTALLWQKTFSQNTANQDKLAKQATHLHYLSIEKRPFALADFKRSCSLWPQFNELSKKLIQQYPSATYGRHQIQFKQLNITLTLLFMPADEALSDLITESEYQQNKLKMDHWFLDGFAPSKNQSMWADDRVQQIAQLSKVGTRLSTYSVSSTVKAPIKNAGFAITKQKGFGRKREMLTAIYQAKIPSEEKEIVESIKQTELTKPTKPTKKNLPSFINIKYQQPWFNLSKTQTTQNIAIIGGGIAGVATAYSLANKGIKVDLFDSNNQLAMGASSAAAGLFHPQLTSDFNLNSQFNWQAYLYLLNFMSNLSEDEKASLIFSQGLLRFSTAENSQQKLSALIKQLGLTQWIKTEFNKDIGIKESNSFNASDALYFPDAASINLTNFCQLIWHKAHCNNKQLYLNSKVSNLTKHDKGWQFNVNEKPFTQTYQQVIFCGGTYDFSNSILSLDSTHITRGQTCIIKNNALANSITTNYCQKNYIVPRGDSEFHIGSSFETVKEFNPSQTLPLSKKTQQVILKNSQSFLKDIGNFDLTEEAIKNSELKGTLGYRLHSADRLPLVGAVVDHKKLKNDFANLGQRRIKTDSISHYNRQGLWMNTGYGSHGILYSLLSAEHLASLILNQVSPISSSLAKAISPVRFAINHLKK
jgi:tRNA 5-methylaminomethyl-2-thiouridine biosynthesis bifunctional protein